MSATHDEKLRYWKELSSHFAKHTHAPQRISDWSSKLCDFMTGGLIDESETEKVMDTYVNHGPTAAIRFCEMRIAILKET